MMQITNSQVQRASKWSGAQDVAEERVHKHTKLVKIHLSETHLILK